MQTFHDMIFGYVFSIQFVICKNVFFYHKVKNVMFGIVHGTSVQYDTSVKIAALEFILKNRPSVLVLRNILLKAVNQEHTEFSTYIHSALLNAADTDIYVQ